MKEYPILFSTEMVKAILDGRKTMTRRIVKHKYPLRGAPKSFSPYWDTDDDTLKKMFGFETEDEFVKCPYQVGMKLWVRETFAYNTFCPPAKVDYKASYPIVEISQRPWKPSIFMPRWASRITLEITDIRVERVQDITDEDAIAEGLLKLTKDNGRIWKYGIPDRDGLPGNDDIGWAWEHWRMSPIDAYQYLWDSINGKKYPWSSNPWVWVISFKRVNT